MRLFLTEVISGVKSPHHSLERSAESGRDGVGGELKRVTAEEEGGDGGFLHCGACGCGHLLLLDGR